MDFESGIIKAVAQVLLGEPNEQLSKNNELRYGSHGSLAIAVAENTFYDHEANYGGGVLGLVKRETDLDSDSAAVAWLQDNNFIPRDQKQAKAKEVKSYDYRDEYGQLLFQVVRYEPKKFVQRRPVGTGWEYRVKGTRQVPYRLPELLAAPINQDVFIVEGEKDADRLAELGLIATCNAGGAGKWRASHAEHLKDRTVIVIADNDDAGRDHANKVAKSLRGIAAHVRLLKLPDLAEKGDVSDYLDSGHTVEDLLKLPTTEPAKPASTGDENSDEEKRSQTDLLVAFAKEHFVLLHDKNGDVYAKDSRTGEVRRLGGRQFKDKLIAGFYEKTKMAVRDQSLREALGTLQALGRFNGDPQDVSVRVAKSGEKYYLDLCEAGNSRAVELCAGSWSIVDRPPVLFVRGEAMQPLPTPLHGGNITPFWRIANVPKDVRIFVVTWLIDTLRPDTPYPGLEFIGEQGSGKSTAAEASRRMIDPSSCNLRGAPKTVEDIFVAARQNHFVAYENVSHLAGPMQDALAILSTGGGYSKRLLYSNDDEHVISVRRPWLLNGIAISVTQQDLVDRVISIECPVIDVRQSSSQQWREFDGALPGILGGILDTASKALEILPSITLPAADRPRLVEFVLLGMAVAQSVGIKSDVFLSKFKELRAETVSRTLDSSPVASAVIELVGCRPDGIADSVKNILIELEHHKPLGAEAWPRTPKGLGDALRRAAPALRQLGIECKAIGKIHGGVIKWSISKKVAEATSPMSTKSPREAKTEDQQSVTSGDMVTWGTSQVQVSGELEVF